jgi:mRNA-degrading endonuclease HigB of HigAB toxin-antitoxin module
MEEYKSSVELKKKISTNNSFGRLNDIQNNYPIENFLTLFDKIMECFYEIQKRYFKHIGGHKNYSFFDK